MEFKKIKNKNKKGYQDHIKVEYKTIFTCKLAGGGGGGGGESNNKHNDRISTTSV